MWPHFADTADVRAFELFKHWLLYSDYLKIAQFNSVSVISAVVKTGLLLNNWKRFLVINHIFSGLLILSDCASFDLALISLKKKNLQEPRFCCNFRNDYKQ